MADNQNSEDRPAPPEAPGVIESLVRERPIAVLIGAVVIGILLGRLGNL